MGLSSFNRMRRSRLEVEELETERFKKDNAARWAAHHSKSKMRKNTEKEVEKIEKAELKAMEAVGRKVEQGIKEGEEGTPDLPLRKDHAAEIVGRTLQHDPQGKPLDPIDRLHERVPPGHTANEDIAGKMYVDVEGPTREEVMAVEDEMHTPEEREMRTSPTKTVAASNAQAAEAAANPEADAKRAKEAKEANAESAKADVATAEADAARRAEAAAGKTVSQKKEEEVAARRAEEAKLPAAGSAPDVGAKGGGATEPVKTTSKK